MSGIFAGAQAVYAEHGVATFPVGGNKKPLIKCYPRIGRPGSAQLAQKYGAASGLGFMTNARNRITLLDYDARDERGFADALARHGNTPLKVRTASGKFHAYYQHKGERRFIRGLGDAPIDVLGSGGFAIAPPSFFDGTGTYQIIEGSLNDLHNLPVMQNLPPEAYVGVEATRVAVVKPEAVPDGSRGVMLFNYLMEIAAAARGRNLSSHEGYELVLKAGLEFNASCLPPMDLKRVQRTAQDVWFEYELKGRNRKGTHGVWLPTPEANRLITTDQDLFILYSYLKSNNSPNSLFMCANGLAHTLGWTRKRLAAARERLELEYIYEVQPASRYSGAALYRWRKQSGHQILKGGQN